MYRGELLLSNNVELDVAVKMIKPGCSTMEVKCLLSEIKILAYLGSHAHICSILAAYTKEISKGTTTAYLCFSSIGMTTVSDSMLIFNYYIKVLSTLHWKCVPRGI